MRAADGEQRAEFTSVITIEIGIEKYKNKKHQLYFMIR